MLLAGAGSDTLLPEAMETASDSPKTKASLFVTCLIDQLFPEVGVSVVNLLRRLGVEVDFPADQTCCGQPLFNAGFKSDAKELAARTLGILGKRLESDEPSYVVVPSGSCASLVRVVYPEMFEDDPELHAASVELAGRTYELSEFIVEVLGVTDAGAKAPGARIAYHPSCHLLRELGVRDAPKSLISNVEGADESPLQQPETCCGFGGTFSIKNSEISTAMLNDKLDDIAASGANTVTACDMSCLMHIGGGLSRRGMDVKALHIAQLLDTGVD